MTTEAAETESGEIAATLPGGASLRAKGYRLMDIAWVVLGAAVIWGGWELKAHGQNSTNETQAIVKSVTDANKAIVDSLKENNTSTVKALEGMAIEQKKSTAAIRLVACLNDPKIRNMVDANEICKRLVRNE